MDNTKLGSTSLEHIPREFLTPKRKTNRVWTLLLIALITLLAFGFWQYQQRAIRDQVQEVVPITPQVQEPEPASFSELEQSLTETEIPSFHETL